MKHPIWLRVYPNPLDIRREIRKTKQKALKAKSMKVVLGSVNQKQKQKCDQEGNK